MKTFAHKMPAHEAEQVRKAFLHKGDRTMEIYVSLLEDGFWTASLQPDHTRVFSADADNVTFA